MEWMKQMTAAAVTRMGMVTLTFLLLHHHFHCRLRTMRQGMRISHPCASFLMR
jgi:hypothetical protein